MTLAIGGVFFWMAAICLGSVYVAPYWNMLFGDNFAGVPAAIAVGLGFYALGAYPIIAWGMKD